MNKITKRDCEKLRALRKEEEHLNSEYISYLCLPKEIVSDIFKDYRTGEEIIKTMTGYGDSKFPVIRANLTRIQRELKHKIYDIEEFIEKQENPEIRIILRMYYSEGLTQEEIGRKLGYSRSGIEKKINRFWKKCSRSSKSDMI